MDLRVAPAAIALSGIDVVAHRMSRYLSFNGFYQRKRTGMGTFMDEAQIDSLHVPRTHDLFWRAQGFRLAFVREAHRYNYVPVSTRGSVSLVNPLSGARQKLCVPAVWIDGFQQGSGMSLDELILPEEIGGIEMYAGPSEVPAQYKEGASCGAILIWTRH